MATPGRPQDEGYTPLAAGDITIYIDYAWFSGGCRLEQDAEALVLPKLIRVTPAKGRGGLAADFFLAAEAPTA